MTDADEIVTAWGLNDLELHAQAVKYVSRIVAKPRYSASPDLRSPSWTAALALEVARSFVRDRDPKASELAVRLIEGGLHDPRLARLAVRLSISSRNPDRIARCIEAVRQRAVVEPRFNSLLLKYVGVVLAYSDLGTVHESLWGFSVRDVSTVGEALALLPDYMDPRPVDPTTFRPDLIDFAYNIRPRRQSRAGFEEELVHRHIGTAYLQFLNGYYAMLASVATTDPSLLAHTKILVGQIEAMIRFEDPTLAEQIAQSKRSVVLAHCHGYRFGWWPHASLRGGRPWSIIGRGAGESSPDAGPMDDFHVPTLSSTRNRDFVKLVKFMRREPRMVELAPDGPDNATLTGAVFGQPISLGPGAAALSYYGNAEIYFAGLDWVGDDIVVKLTPICRPEDSATYEAHEAKFVEGYCRCLEAIVAGNPAPMGDLIAPLWTAIAERAGLNAPVRTRGGMEDALKA